MWGPHRHVSGPGSPASPRVARSVNARGWWPFRWPSRLNPSCDMSYRRTCGRSTSPAHRPLSTHTFGQAAGYSLSDTLARVRPSPCTTFLNTFRSISWSMFPSSANLSAWSRDDMSVSEFLGRYLYDHSGYLVDRPTTASAWVESGVFALGLDGFDEIDNSNRSRFITALTSFCMGFPSVPVVLTSRVQEWQVLLRSDSGEPVEAPVGLRAAIELLPLPVSVVSDVAGGLLTEDGRYPPDPRWSVLAAAQALPATEVLRRPLFLGLAIRSGLDPRELAACKTETQAEDLVLNQYVWRAFDAGAFGSFEYASVQHWLAFLAGLMAGRSPSKVAVPQLPDSSSLRLQDLAADQAGGRPHVVTSITAGVAFAVALSFAVNPISGVVVGLLAAYGIGLRCTSEASMQPSELAWMAYNIRSCHSWSSRRRHRRMGAWRGSGTAGCCFRRF